MRRRERVAWWSSAVDYGDSDAGDGRGGCIADFVHPTDGSVRGDGIANVEWFDGELFVFMRREGHAADSDDEGDGWGTGSGPSHGIVMHSDALGSPKTSA